MCKFNVVDILSIQECMEGYKKLIEWMPAMDEYEEEMKGERLKIISRINRICEEVISKEKGGTLFGYGE